MLKAVLVIQNEVKGLIIYLIGFFTSFRTI